MAVSLKRSVTGPAMAVSALACALAAQAQGFKPPPAPSTGPPAHDYVSDTQLAQLFTAFCIKAFPDAAAVDAALKVHSQAQLTPEQAMPYLPDGSGVSCAWECTFSAASTAAASGKALMQKAVNSWASWVSET